MKSEIYFKILEVNNTQSVLDLFYNSLRETNREFGFFVKWAKIKKYYEEHKFGINILNTLINDTDFENTLREMLNRYPEVLPVIPLLIAIRDLEFPIVEKFSADVPNYFRYNFEKEVLSPDEIENIIDFFARTGLKEMFLNFAHKSLTDYYLGIEVGLDSHARKNRSGEIMENYIFSQIKNINKSHNNKYEIIKQKKYSYLKKNYDYDISRGLSNRKADFLLIENNTKVIAIETNFYRGTGSKPQEIVNSYIQRQGELKKHNIDFIWITDGVAWQKQKNQMDFAFDKLDYILNIKFVKLKLLDKILSII